MAQAIALQLPREKPCKACRALTRQFRDRRGFPVLLDAMPSPGGTFVLLRDNCSTGPVGPYWPVEVRGWWHHPTLQRWALHSTTCGQSAASRARARRAARHNHDRRRAW